jgi:hypothetical protein
VSIELVSLLFQYLGLLVILCIATFIASGYIYLFGYHVSTGLKLAGTTRHVGSMIIVLTFWFGVILGIIGL